MSKKKIKLAVIRSGDTKECPFGLPISEGCKNAGELIHNLAPLDILGEDSTEEEKEEIAEANKTVFDKVAPGERCPFARHFFENEEVVECSWGQHEPGGHGEGATPKGSPSWEMFNGMAGAFSIPNGYYFDNSIDRGFYYGPFSLESIASQEATNKNQYNKGTSHGETNMSLAKEAQLDFDGFSLSVQDPEPLPVQTPKPQPLPADGDKAQPLPGGDDEAVEADNNALEGPGVIMMEVDEEEGEKSFDFKLPRIPGAYDQTELEVEEGEEEDVVVENDLWSWTVSNLSPGCKKCGKTFLATTVSQRVLRELSLILKQLIKKFQKLVEWILEMKFLLK